MEKNMKKFIITLFILLQPAVFANYNDIYIADIQFDWINKSEVEKEAIISEVRDIIFESPVEKQKDFKDQFRDKLKDKDHWENYMAASSGYKEFKGNNISAYYDALGNLKYVDFIYGEYPDYPYYSIQYRISGKPVSAIYFVSKDCQYLFKPDGEFEGVWYKHNLYNKESEIILTRTTY